jgi:hypothetical protein
VTQETEDEIAKERERLRASRVSLGKGKFSEVLLVKKGEVEVSPLGCAEKIV